MPQHRQQLAAHLLVQALERTGAWWAAADRVAVASDPMATARREAGRWGQRERRETLAALLAFVAVRLKASRRMALYGALTSACWPDSHGGRVQFPGKSDVVRWPDGAAAIARYGERACRLCGAKLRDQPVSGPRRNRRAYCSLCSQPARQHERGDVEEAARQVFEHAREALRAGPAWAEWCAALEEAALGDDA